MTADTLPVVEIFGPTIQGEGPMAGRAAAFLRFAGCSLSCSWCDTPESWQPGRMTFTSTTVPSVVAALPPTVPVVITGGEPLLQQRRKAWSGLLLALAARGVWLETNGTVEPDDTTLQAMTLMVVSPKLSNAGPHNRGQSPAVHAAWRLAGTDDRIHGKYVVGNEDDIAEALAHATELGLPPERTWLMPQAVTVAEHNTLWPLVANTAAAAGVNASPRLHVLAWPGERGR